MPYKRAVAAGTSAPKAAVFMNFREALAAGRVESEARSTSVVQAADGIRKEPRSKAIVTFIQDQSGRVVRKAD
jgi:hypothetical protein